MFIDTSSRLYQVLSDIVADEGLLLYDLEQKGSLLVVYLAPAQSRESAVQEAVQQGGVTSGDCTRVCHRLQIFFRAEGKNLGVGTEPVLEVSSPGINRQLRLPQHFSGAVGERVKVVTKSEKIGVLVGILTKVDSGTLSIEEEGKGVLREIGLEDIKRAHVDFRFC